MALCDIISRLSRFVFNRENLKDNNWKVTWQWVQFMITTLWTSRSQKCQTIIFITHTNLQEMSIPSLQRSLQISINSTFDSTQNLSFTDHWNRQTGRQSVTRCLLHWTLTSHWSSRSASRRLDLNCAISSTCRQHRNRDVNSLAFFLLQSRAASGSFRMIDKSKAFVFTWS
jgi:hypothetical protein